MTFISYESTSDRTRHALTCKMSVPDYEKCRYKLTVTLYTHVQVASNRTITLYTVEFGFSAIEGTE